MLDLIFAAAEQEGDGRPGRRAGADGAAVGGEGADPGLLVDGHQIGDDQGTEEGILVLAQLPGVLHHGHGHGDALIAGAGIDDHRQLTAAHPGVGPGGGLGLAAGGHAVSELPQEYLAHVAAVAALEALLADGHVIVHLALEHVPHVVQVHGPGKLHDVPDGEQPLLGGDLADGAGGVHRLFQQHGTVFFDEDHVGVVVDDPHPGPVVPGVEGDDEVQHQAAVQKGDLAHPPAHHVLDAGLLLPAHHADDLQGLPGVPGHDPGGHRRLNALEPVGVGHHHALDVFDEVPAGLDLHALRHGPQGVPGQGGGIGDGDGLGTAHRGHQLLVEDLHIGVVDFRLHDRFPPNFCTSRMSMTTIFSISWMEQYS